MVIKIRLGPEYGGTNYALWLIAGLLPWLFFAEAVNRAPNGVVGNSNLIKKMVFPSEIMPFVHLVVALVNHLIGVGILFGFLLFLDYGVSLKILLIIPYILAISIFILGISWFLSALNVFLRDVGQIIGVLVYLWFFLTPILYTPQMIPESLQGVFSLNPMLHAIEGYRIAVLDKVEMDIAGLVYLLFCSLFIFVLGALTFKRLKPEFADVL
ncbi:MAG: ABC transporter permease [Candidatus Dadabacteria bacterium]|nr:ABC transporter permease [Candidatus Dadabacteria bacterium]NIQ14700.1 ABC transporter permease [Candidatus Dadabacteria bacterium]